MAKPLEKQNLESGSKSGLFNFRRKGGNANPGMKLLHLTPLVTGVESGYLSRKQDGKKNI